ncbi:MAG: hypothetical protein RIQ79_469, partial [Verrucomicrobiota bacterium]
MPDKVPARHRPKGRWRRRLVWTALTGLTVLLGVCASLDYWGTALAAKRAGVTYDRSEALLGRLVTWKGVHWSERNVTLDASQAVVSSPWQVLFRTQADMQMNGWILTIDTTKQAAGRKSGAWGDLIPALRTIGQTLDRWVGEASFTEGRIRVAGERITVSRLSVKGGTLTGIAKTHGQNVEFTVGLLSGLVQLHWPDGKVSVSGQVNQTGFKGLLRWEGNMARLTGGFESGKWIPENLLAEGHDWRVPAGRLGLGELYEDLRGDFMMRRKGDGVELALAGTAQPLARGFPVANYKLGGEVSANRARLEVFQVDSAQLRAHLSAPLEWRAGEGWHSEGEPVFDWSADLATFTAGQVTGRAEGMARWEGGPEQPWNVRWSAKVTDGAWRNLRGAAVELRGSTDAAATRLDAIKVSLADGSQAEASGRFIYSDGWTIEAAKLSGETNEPALRNWLPGLLPTGLHLGRVGFAVQGGGKWPALAYEGEVHVGPSDCAGWAADHLAFAVKGRETVLEKLEVEAKRGAARLNATLAGDLRKGLGGEASLHRADGRELVPAGLSEIDWADNHLGAR